MYRNNFTFLKFRLFQNSSFFLDFLILFLRKRLSAMNAPWKQIGKCLGKCISSLHHLLLSNLNSWVAKSEEQETFQNIIRIAKAISIVDFYSKIDKAVRKTRARKQNWIFNFFFSSSGLDSLLSNLSIFHLSLASSISKHFF